LRIFLSKSSGENSEWLKREKEQREEEEWGQNPQANEFLDVSQTACAG
jgi:hypothetical protein